MYLPSLPYHAPENGEDESEPREGSVLQRFPVENWKNTSLPRVIEIVNLLYARCDIYNGNIGSL